MHGVKQFDRRISSEGERKKTRDKGDSLFQVEQDKYHCVYVNV